MQRLSDDYSRFSEIHLTDLNHVFSADSPIETIQNNKKRGKKALRQSTDTRKKEAKRQSIGSQAGDKPLISLG